MGIELGQQAKSAEKPSIIVSGLGQQQVSTMDEGAQGAAAVVLDTNVVLDWLVFDDPATRQLASALDAGQLRWIATEPMLAELLHVLQRPELDRWRPACEAARERIAAAGCRVELPPPRGRVPVCRDPADQMFIELALAWGAPWLLTRDKALLQLARAARAAGTAVCTPARWAAPA